MNTDHAVELLQSAAWVMLTIGSPLLGAIAVVSLIVGILQAATQVHDPTVNSVPRLVVGILCLIWLLPWMASRLLEYTHESFAGAVQFF